MQPADEGLCAPNMCGQQRGPYSNLKAFPNRRLVGKARFHRPTMVDIPLLGDGGGQNYTHLSHHHPFQQQHQQQRQQLHQTTHTISSSSQHHPSCSITSHAITGPAAESRHLPRQRWGVWPQHHFAFSRLSAVAPWCIGTPPIRLDEPRSNMNHLIAFTG